MVFFEFFSGHFYGQSFMKTVGGPSEISARVLFERKGFIP